MLFSCQAMFAAKRNHLVHRFRKSASGQDVAIRRFVPRLWLWQVPLLTVPPVKRSHVGNLKEVYRFCGTGVGVSIDANKVFSVRSGIEVNLVRRSTHERAMTRI